MSEPRRVLLVGATGLVGTRVMEECVGRDDVRLVALTRREAPMPRGARMEMLVADPAEWDRSLATVAPDAVICALGTTWRKAGEDEAAFRAVDQELVLRVARAAKAAGTSHFVFVSSAGASIASRALYLRVKAEVEAALRKIGFFRLDMLRPGLLRGPRPGDRRPVGPDESFERRLVDLVGSADPLLAWLAGTAVPPRRRRSRRTATTGASGASQSGRRPR